MSNYSLLSRVSFSRAVRSSPLCRIPVSYFCHFHTVRKSLVRKIKLNKSNGKADFILSFAVRFVGPFTLVPSVSVSMLIIYVKCPVVVSAFNISSSVKLNLSND